MSAPSDSVDSLGGSTATVPPLNVSSVTSTAVPTHPVLAHPAVYYQLPSASLHSSRPTYTSAQLSLLRSMSRDSDGYAPVKKEHMINPRAGKFIPILETEKADNKSDNNNNNNTNNTPQPEQDGAAAADVAVEPSRKARKLAPDASASSSSAVPLSGGECTRSAVSAASAPVDQVSGGGSADGPPEAAPEGAADASQKKRKRGQNKNHEREIYSERLQVRLCKATSMGLECKWPERCKFSHDAAAFQSVKGPDYPGPCPIFKVYGACPAGLTCRYALEGHAPAYAPASMPSVPAPIALECNIPSKEFLNDLRLSASCTGKVYERLYPRTHTFMVAYERWKKMFDALRERKQQEKQKKQREILQAQKAAREAQEAQSHSTPTTCGDPSATQPAASSAVASAIATPAAASAGVSAVGGVVSSISSSTISATVLPPTFPPLTAAEEIEVAAFKSLYTPAYPTRVDPFQIVSNEYVDWSSGVILIDVERKAFDFRNKLYLAPLTTVGNLPFRLVCKDFGCDVTIGEMALSPSLTRGGGGEWALLRRHAREKEFGVQVTAAFTDQLARACEVIQSQCNVDFVDLNIGCPIDQVTSKGMGSALMQQKRNRNLEPMMRAMTSILDCPATIKMRMGWSSTELTCMELLPVVNRCGMAAVTIHGRTRQQRYTKAADRDFIRAAATFAKEKCNNLPVIANGDIYTFDDYESLIHAGSDVTSVMIARGALVKPWIFTEIRERRHWDISATERLDCLRAFVAAGHEHFGTDTKGIENTRRYLLEWLSFLHRYVPVGLLEVPQVSIQHKSPGFYARSDLEQLLASPASSDWIRISEMLIGPVPSGFRFVPKHKSATNSEEGGG